MASRPTHTPVTPHHTTPHHTSFQLPKLIVFSNKTTTRKKFKLSLKLHLSMDAESLYYVSLFLIFLSSLFFSLHLLFYTHNKPHHHHQHHHKSSSSSIAVAVVTSPLSLPPGRTGWPFIGETLEFLSTGFKGHPEKFIVDRVAKYASPNVFRTSLLGEAAAVFCGPAANKFLFSNENKLVVSWWPSSVNKIFPTSTQTSSAGHESLKMRRMLPHLLKPDALRRHVSVMDDIARRHFASDWDGKDRVEVFPLAKRYTFWVACRLFMSVEDPCRVAEFATPFGHLASGIMSMPIDLPGTAYNRAIKAAKAIRKHLLVMIRKRKEEVADGRACGTQDILSHMLVARDEEGKPVMSSDFDIADKILGLLIGGHDTASAACTFIVKYLAELPHVYNQVYREQMEIAKAKREGELLNWEDIQKMKYSWNVACEVMRLSPPLPGAFREALSDFVFDGFIIPKGWKLYWSANSTHKNPRYFPEPEKFDPSRFEGSGPEPYTFVPFGGGPRMCPGKEYARLEILVFMHNLVRRFKWEKLLADEKIIVNPMPMPAKGLPIRLCKHTNEPASSESD